MRSEHSGGRGLAAGSFLPGIVYGAAVFGVGFVLGAVRTMLLVGALGISPVLAVLAEIPLILTAAWWICGWILAAFAVAGSIAARALMGTVAFAVLMAAELALALAFGIAPADFLRGYLEPAGLLGLAAQIAFAVFPLLRR